MNMQIVPEDNDLPLFGFEPSQIFIGREQEQTIFELYLNAWIDFTFYTEPDDALIVKAPSFNNKIQGLVVLLHGRSGFGKSTLLKKYRDIVAQENQNPLSRQIKVSDIVDWESEVEGERSTFNISDPKEINTANYFKLLCSQLASALDKKPKDFREYQNAIKDIEKAQKKANSILENIQKDDRYAWLRGLTIEAITTAVRT